MSEHIMVKKEPALPMTDAIAFSNSIRLTASQWLGVAVFAVVFVIAAPTIWKQVEPFKPEADDRMPHELSQDYWLFERYAGLAVEDYDAVLLGDSVVWGEYVTRHETLSHYVNQQTGKKSLANLGVGGAHPLALTGLIEHYGGSIANKNVVLQCNPLWMSSLKSDLQDEKFTDFNHPRLVPQFFLHIPAYSVPWLPDNPDEKQKISQRLGFLVEQRVPFSKWTNHLQQAYYEQSDMPGWTLKHPYDNPLEPLMRELPAVDDTPRYLQLPWYKTGKTKTDFAWIDMDKSLQWRGFQMAVDILQRRGNRVFVLVGPFNEHMLRPASLARYGKVKETIANWLQEKQIAHLAPAVLPSEQYGDASHPLAIGYETLARRLLADPAFQSVISPR